MSCLCGYCGGVVDSITFVFTKLHTVGQASPCLSQSDTWLLIYGREKAKQVAASKTSLLLFSSNVKK